MLYFFHSVDNSLDTLGNWWTDVSHTTPASALPQIADDVQIDGTASSGTCSCASVINQGTISGGTYNAATIANYATVSGGTLHCDGTMSAGGTWSGGTLTGRPVSYMTNGAAGNIKKDIVLGNVTGTYDPMSAAVFPAAQYVHEYVTAYGPTGAEYAGALRAASLASSILSVYGAASGTVQAGSTSTVIQTNLTSTTTDTYKDCYLVLTSGTGTTQARPITAYNSSTKAVTVAPAFGVTPATNDTFIITGRSDA